MKLTTEQKEHKVKVDKHRHLTNVVLSAFNFKKIKTWSDVYTYEGIEGNNGHTPVTYQEVKSYLESKSPKQLVVSAAALPSSSVVPSPILIVKPVVVEPVTPTVNLTAEENYGLHHSPNEEVFFYWFQKLAIANLWNNTITNKRRGSLLLASTGTGKTFMVGGYIRRLVDIKYADMKSFGPTKYLYITRATVVEQTKRVFAKHFKLGIKDGVEVLNIEQLRSKAGEFWIDEKITVVDGVEIVTYTWRPMLHPVVMVVDECQSVKNEGSTQSKIITSYSQIPNTDTICVFVSATPFTKVAEAKSFVVNCHFNDQG